MKNLLYSILICITGLSANAQTIGADTISWTSTKAFNEKTEVSLGNKFITYGNTRIEWVQVNDDEETYSYDVVEVLGEWANLSRQGKVEFKVRLGDREGSIFFYRNTKGLRVKIEMLRDGTSMVPFEFIISEYTKSN